AHALEPPREIANRYAQYHSRVEATAPADRSTEKPPIANSAARDIARAQYEIGSGHGPKEGSQVAWIVREIGVHLDQEVRAAGQRVSESRRVGRAEALLARAVKPLHQIELRGEAVCDRAGAVGRVVVDDQDPVVVPAEPL